MDLVRERYGSQVANVHRLDSDASGVTLFAKTKPALDFLSGQFQSKTARLSYRALVVALPPARLEAGGGFTVDLALGEDEAAWGRMRVFRKRGGKPSATDVIVLESFGRFAWVECRPQTGRPHQVRVHLASHGAPVLNDALYGDKDCVLLLSGLKRRYKGAETERPLISRLALHAASLGFTHPFLRVPMEASAPLPREFEIALKYLRRFPGPGAARPA